MNLKHLGYFTKVVQRGSIKSAAEVLGVTQPAISAAISKLEAELGVPLLTRDVNGSAPTMYGQSLYSSALTMASVTDSARRKITALRDPTSGHIRIGTGPSVAARYISRMIADLITTYPGIRIDHVAGNTYDEFEQKLLAEDIDIAFCTIQPEKVSRAVQFQMVNENPIGMFMSREHLPHKKTSISNLDVLSNFRWIVLRDDERRSPEGVSESSGRQYGGPALSVTVDDVSIIRQLTLATKSVGFFPLQDAIQDLQAGALVELYVKNTPTTVRPIYALTKADAYTPPTVELFLKTIQTSVKTNKMSNLKHKRIAIVR
jgi:LysR family transcriptional regulator, regulator for genes of the gallate degradation pathway